MEILKFFWTIFYINLFTIGGGYVMLPLLQREVVDHYHWLSKGLIDDGQFEISVVVAHMAREVSTERALSAAFASKGLQYLEEPVLDFLNGYNLANDRNRNLYTALTADHIERQTFWPEFKESATRRNKIVHSSGRVSQADAERSYRAASAFVSHLNPRGSR
jgi:hypothetical protein